MKIYVSLTTISDRVGSVHRTIQSMLNQTIKPHKIYVYLSKEPFLLDKGIPPQVLEQTELYKLYKERNDIVIQYVSNTGPYRKLLPFLSSQTMEAEDVVITVDDDSEYKKDCIEWLVMRAKEHPNAVIANMGCKLDVQSTYNAYFNNNRCLPPLLDSRNLAIGFAGVLYRPHFFHKDDTILTTFDNNEIKTDDLYYKICTYKRGVSVYVNNYYSISSAPPVRGLFGAYNGYSTNGQGMRNNDIAFFSLCAKKGVSPFHFVGTRKLYFINLEHRKDRCQRLLNEIGPHLPSSYKLERWNATTHAQGWLGCIQSHATVLSNCMKTNFTGMYGVLEDDCKMCDTPPVFRERFQQIMSYLEEHYGEWDMFLGGGAYVKPIKVVSMNPLLVQCDWAVCLQFAVHSKKSAETVIEYAKNLNHCRAALDTHIAGKHRGKILVPYPYLLTQHSDDSNIGSSEQYIQKIKTELIRSETLVGDFVKQFTVRENISWVDPKQ